MKITVDGTEYEYDPDSLTNKEAMGIESVLGVTFQQWGEQLAAGSAGALTALVWLIQKREQPALRFSDVEFQFAKLDVETPEEEATPDPTEPATS